MKNRYLFFAAKATFINKNLLKIKLNLGNNLFLLNLENDFFCYTSYPTSKLFKL